MVKLFIEVVLVELLGSGVMVKLVTKRNIIMIAKIMNNLPYQWVNKRFILFLKPQILTIMHDQVIFTKLAIEVIIITPAYELKSLFK